MTTKTTTSLVPDDRVRLVDLRTSPLTFRSASPSSDSIGTLVGYMAVFDSWTEIDGWEGHFLERFAQGSFEKTLREHRDTIKVLYNHGIDPQIGEKPLGVPEVLEERTKGLYVEVPLDDTSYNRDLVPVLRSGALNGMSVRFRVKESGSEWVQPASKTKQNPKKISERTIVEVDRLYEGGPVTFPAYTATAAGVRDWKTAKALRERRVRRLVRHVDEVVAAAETNSRRQRVELLSRVVGVQIDIALKEAETARRRYGW